MLIDKINKPINIINTIYSGGGGVTAKCAPCARLGYEAVIFFRHTACAHNVRLCAERHTWAHWAQAVWLKK